MDENTEGRLQELVGQNKVKEAISVVEQQILQNPIADFTGAVGKSLLHLTNDLVESLDQFFAAANNEIAVQSLYAEMNGFTINYDQWYVDLFAFNRDEGRDDMDWLADYNYSSATSLPIVGLENIQAMYEHYLVSDKWTDEDNENAAYECAVLVVLRVQELFQAAKEAAKAKELQWAAVPIYATAHDSYFDLICRV